MAEQLKLGVTDRTIPYPSLAFPLCPRQLEEAREWETDSTATG